MGLLAVDPAVLAGAGVGALGVGEGLMPAVAALSAGFHANTGQDSAGVMFGRQYADAADAVLAAVAAGINACTQTGYGVQVSAVNYSRAEAMSDISGRAQPLGSPACPVPVSAPPGPSATGTGVGEPLLWAVVAMLVGDLWPSGSPAGMRAAAGAWRAFGAVLDGVSGELAGPSAVVGAQQMPEAEQIVSVLRGIGSDFAAIGAQCAAVASQLEGFAADVEATQNAIRDLLARLGSIGGIVGEFFQFLRGHGEEELERIAADIRTVQGHLRNEASAKRAALGQVKAAVDSWVLGLEEAANRQFTEFFGEDVGRLLSAAFNYSADSSEGGFRWLVSNYEGLEDLNPARWAYDPAGAAATWKGLDQFARVAVNPGYLGDLWRTDPEAAEVMVKGLVRADEWDSQRPMVGLSQNLLDVATLPFAAGDAAKAGDAASIATRVAEEGKVLEEGGALPRVVGKLGEAGRAGEALDQVAKNSAGLTEKLEKTAAPVADKPPVGDKAPVGDKVLAADKAPVAEKATVGGKPVGLERPSESTPAAVVEKGPGSAPESGNAAVVDATDVGPAPRVSEGVATETSSGEHASNAHSVAAVDPPMDGRSLLHSSEPVNEHWHHLNDGPSNPQYGEPLEHPGTSPEPAPVTEFNRRTWDLFKDPNELYGHDARGHPLTKEQYDERYRELRPNGIDVWDHYPPNDGAVPGTKWVNTSPKDFIERFGADVDRIGAVEGKYLGITEGGVPAYFEERGLPISSLNEAYYRFRLTGNLPEGWTMEISEVAPAFGRDGGGLQLLIKNARGIKQSIDDLIQEEVILDLDGAIR